MTKAEAQSFLKDKLSKDSKWALRALLVIYNCQTVDEQQVGTTKHHNNKGFTGADAEFLSSLAEQYLKRKFLTSRQLVYLMKKMPKYWKQLLSLSDLAKLEAAYQKEKQGPLQQSLKLYADLGRSHVYNRPEFEKYFGEATIGKTLKEEVAVPGTGYYVYRIEKVTSDKVFINVDKELSTVRELTLEEVK